MSTCRKKTATAGFASDGAAVTDDNRMMKSFDDKTFTNAGLSVGMGAFSFGASYATRDDGGYVLQCLDSSDEVVACGELQTDGSYNGAGVDSIKAVENEAQESDTWAVGITYSDGPMSVSIDHVSHERENGDERTATGVSAGYKLAPGVDWKTSIIAVEDDTWKNAATGTTGSEGTIFVTGLDLAF